MNSKCWNFMLIEIRSIICEKQWWWLRYCYIATMSLENPQHNLFRRKITFALFTMKTTATAVPFHTAHSVNSNWINWVLTVVLRDSISIVVVVVVGVCSFTQLLFLFLFFYPHDTPFTLDHRLHHQLTTDLSYDTCDYLSCNWQWRDLVS